MTQGFYEQLGVGPNATQEEIRAAYQRLVTAQIRRRKKVLEEGGDSSSLDLARAQADEAWEVLSDQARRQRYDAMLGLADQAIQDAHDLWGKVSGAFVSPAAATAAELLRSSTHLSVGAMPETVGVAGVPKSMPVPSQPTRLSVESSSSQPSVSAVPLDTQVPTVADFPSEPGAVPSSGSLYELRTPNELPGLSIVDGSPDASPVYMLPSAADRESAISAEDILRLVDEHGYTGALLQSVRQARTITLQDMADTTRISARYLTAIEDDNYDVLPSATFVRGYIREMARMLGMDEDRVVDGYMTRYSR
jgi:hypothetical protein